MGALGVGCSAGESFPSLPEAAAPQPHLSGCSNLGADISADLEAGLQGTMLQNPLTLGRGKGREEEERRKEVQRHRGAERGPETGSVCLAGKLWSTED